MTAALLLNRLDRVRLLLAAQRVRGAVEVAAHGA